MWVALGPLRGGRFGFSLAEVLLALALAATVVLLMVALSLTALKGNQKATDQTLAQSVAHQWVERELYQAQQNSGSALWSANSDTATYSITQVSVGQQAYTMALYVSDSNDPATPRLKKLRLRVSWWGGEPNRAGYGQLWTEVIRFASAP